MDKYLIWNLGFKIKSWAEHELSVNKVYIKYAFGMEEFSVTLSWLHLTVLLDFVANDWL